MTRKATYKGPTLPFSSVSWLTKVEQISYAMAIHHAVSVVDLVNPELNFPKL